MNIKDYLSGLEQWFFANGLQIVIIAGMAVFVSIVARAISRRLIRRVVKAAPSREAQKRAETLGAVIRHTVDIVILGVAILMILKTLNIDIGPILGVAGVIGLAVGFGAQDLVKDVVAGFFILLEDQIRVGDVVSLGDKGGAVEKVNLRMVVLRDLEGNVHYVRNGHIDVVTNKTKEFSRYVFDVGVAYRENVDEVIKVLNEVDADMRADPEFGKEILEPLEIMGLNKFDDSAVVVRARNKTIPGSQWRVGREFNRRLKKAFDSKDIEIPFPHVTLYMGKDKNGEAPPLHLAVDGRRRGKTSAKKGRRR